LKLQNTSLSWNFPFVRLRNLKVITFWAGGMLVVSQKPGGAPPSSPLGADPSSPPVEGPLSVWPPEPLSEDVLGLPSDSEGPPSRVGFPAPLSTLGPDPASPRGANCAGPSAPQASDAAARQTAIARRGNARTGLAARVREEAIGLSDITAEKATHVPPLRRRDRADFSRIARAQVRSKRTR
jgi:hypothetical protein